MSKDPAFLFYTSDFLTGTILLSDEQVGKYIRLMCIQHQKGRLSEKDMLRICKAYDEDIFAKFIKDDNGLYYSKRLNDEIDKRKHFTDSRLNNLKGTHKKPHMGKHTAPHMEDEDINVIKDANISEIFNKFWELYPKRNGKVVGKKECKDYFKNIKQEDFPDLLKATGNYAGSSKAKDGYAKDPIRFLKKEFWTDWLEPETPDPKPGQGGGYTEPGTVNYPTAAQLRARGALNK